MGEYWGKNRRGRPRHQCDRKVRCFVRQQRLSGSFKEIGPGGGFLLVDRIVRPGAVVVVEWEEGTPGSLPTHLVAKVVHFELSPQMGMGVQWLKAVSPNGASALRRFLADAVHVELPDEAFVALPPAAEELPVGYDFQTGRVGMERMARQAMAGEEMVELFGIKVRKGTTGTVAEVQVVHTEAPKQKRAQVDKDESIETRDDHAVDAIEAAKVLEEWMRILRARKRVTDRVTLVCGTERREVTVVGLDANDMFVESADELPQQGMRVLLQYPLSAGGKPLKVIVVGEVRRMLHDASHKRYGADIHIITLNEGDAPGTYRAYLKRP